MYLWCKWTVSELRTSNLAEAFHRELRTLIKVRHPSLATLLHHLHKNNLEAACALKRIELAPGEQRTLRRKDQARKDKINEAMQKMQQERERGLSTAEVMLYCRRMSTYLSEKGV
ncbi:hypothetical protein Aduo_013843 [Ancylostoma duodenale]